MIHGIDEELLSLESDANVITMRAQERKRRALLKKQEKHQELMELSKSEPRLSLKKAVILSSNKICDDCSRFVERVNYSFRLNIELSWRTDESIGGTVSHIRRKRVVRGACSSTIL
jgi:cell fate regulator YaaT (PSP1 superfamily)